VRLLEAKVEREAAAATYSDGTVVMHGYPVAVVMVSVMAVMAVMAMMAIVPIASVISDPTIRYAV
jgi:hypothetical protein